MRKNAMITAATLAAVVLLTGCAQEREAPATPGPVGGTTEVIHVDVDGRSVTCVVWDGYNAGGISCDWSPSAR